MIHQTAIVHETATVGDDVEIGPFCIIEAGVQLGAKCRIMSHAVVRAGCVVGDGVYLDSFVVVGGDAQMRAPASDAVAGSVRIGDRTVLREGVTIHRPSTAEGVTEVGPDCYLMAQSHVAHDCRLGAFVTLANCAMLAGHVDVGAHVFIGGGAGVHQFARIGSSAMVAGNAAISADVPPFTVVADRNDVVGLNLIGLRRRGLAAPVIRDLKACFRSVYLASGNVRIEAAKALTSAGLGETEQGREFLEFFAGGKRGFGHSRSRHRSAGNA